MATTQSLETCDLPDTAQEAGSGPDSREKECFIWPGEGFTFVPWAGQVR